MFRKILTVSWLTMVFYQLIKEYLSMEDAIFSVVAYLLVYIVFKEE